MIDTWRDYLGVPVFPNKLIENCRDVIRQSSMTPPFENRRQVLTINLNYHIKVADKRTYEQPHKYTSHEPAAKRAAPQTGILRDEP